MHLLDYACEKTLNCKPLLSLEIAWAMMILKRATARGNWSRFWSMLNQYENMLMDLLQVYLHE